MATKRQVVLRLRSNIDRYQLTVYDGNCSIRRSIYERQECLCLRPCAPYLRIVASPRASGYTTTLYLWVDVTCKSVIDLSLQFPSAPVRPTGAIQRFTLRDANYGLPIDGVLLFTAT